MNDKIWKEENKLNTKENKEEGVANPGSESNYPIVPSQDLTTLEKRLQPIESRERGPRMKVVERFKKKSFTIKLYPAEHAALLAAMKEYGFKRKEFILACVNRANKRNLTAKCKRLEKEHTKMKEDEEKLVH